MGELQVVAWQCDWIDCAKISEPFVDYWKESYKEVPQIKDWILIQVVWVKPEFLKDSQSTNHMFCSEKCRDAWIKRFGSSLHLADYPYKVNHEVPEYWEIDDSE